jgi:hypothetical protein
MRIRLFVRPAALRRRKRLLLTSGLAAGYYPLTDISVAGWTGTPGAPLYANVDEVTAGDADYNTSPGVTPTPAPAIHAIANAPLGIGSWNVNIRCKASASGRFVRARLYDNSGAEVGASALQAVTTSFADYALAITSTGSAFRVGYEFTS